MKKIYMIPVTEIVKVEVANHILAGSGKLGVGDPGSADLAESREYDSFWDDEDEY